MPQRLAVPFISCDERAAGVAVKQNPAGCREHSRPVFAFCRADLRNFPNNLARFDIQSAQIFSFRRYLRSLGVPIAGLRYKAALLESHHVIESGRGTERRGVVVGGLIHRAEDAVIRLAKLWSSIGADTARPRHLDEWFG